MHSLAGEGVGDYQFRRGDIHAGTLGIYVFIIYVQRKSAKNPSFGKISPKQ
jgi:hypothetical protein